MTETSPLLTPHKISLHFTLPTVPLHQKGSYISNVIFTNMCCTELSNDTCKEKFPLAFLAATPDMFCKSSHSSLTGCPSKSITPPPKLNVQELVQLYKQRSVESVRTGKCKMLSQPVPQTMLVRNIVLILMYKGEITMLLSYYNSAGYSWWNDI